MLKLMFAIIPSLIQVSMSNDTLENTVTVNAPFGPIKGIRKTFSENGIQINEFRGIRYGKAPVGPLRFRKPVPSGRWTGTLDATKFGSTCPQQTPKFIPGLEKPKISEDCLFLNVYVPKALNPNRKLPVMVWIHGGAFIMGSGHEFNGGRIATQGDVIVVTINYRLGILGFFALAHPAAKGNYAVWDQKLALQWVHDNIAAFGGNPGSVTVFGQSAGGWSSNVLAMIPSNKGLLHKVISQSGVFDFGRKFTWQRNQLMHFAEIYANRTGCPLIDLYTFTDCLRQIPIDELIFATDPLNIRPSDKFLPELIASAVIDGELFTDNPFRLLEDSSSDVAQFFRSIDFIAGTTSNEGNTVFLVYLTPLQQYYGFNMSEGIPSKVGCEGMIAPYVNVYLNNNAESKKKLCDFYHVDGTLGEQGLGVSESFADIFMLYPTVKMLEYHSILGGNTYQYQFSKLSPDPYGGTPPSWYKGSGHCDELVFMFSDLAEVNVALSDIEKEFAAKMINYWTSFAKSSNPNAGGQAVQWEQFDIIERKYLDLDFSITAARDISQESMTLLSKIPGT